MRGFLFKFIKFSGVAILAYLLVLTILVNTSGPKHFNGKVMTNVPLNRPEGGLSALRFREADDFGKVDVVFLGSSHCYRTFDAQWYAQQGTKAFNLGSTSQAPTITYHLAGKYLEAMDPGLVVLEVYSETLRSNGAESLLDQLANRPMDMGLLRMTAAVGGIKAWNAFLIHLLDFTHEPVALRNPAQRPVNGNYVSGGFVRRDLMEGGLNSYEESLAPVNTKQLEYIDRLLELVLSQGRKIVLVGQPLPEKTLAAIADYHEVQALVQDLASAHGVPFYDFNGLVQTDSSVDLHNPALFYDYHHFNPQGVAAFNPVFLDLLRRSGWL